MAIPSAARRWSSGTFLLLLHANAMWRTAFSNAESADVNVELSKSANQSAPMHSQSSGGFALIPIRISEDDKNELLSKLLQRFRIEDSGPVHPPHQCLKLCLRSVRVFSTHLTGAAVCIPETETESASPDFVRLLGRAGQLGKNGAFSFGKAWCGKEKSI